KVECEQNIAITADNQLKKGSAVNNGRNGVLKGQRIVIVVILSSAAEQVVPEIIGNCCAPEALTRIGINEYQVLGCDIAHRRQNEQRFVFSDRKVPPNPEAEGSVEAPKFLRILAHRSEGKIGGEGGWLERIGRYGCANRILWNRHRRRRAGI